MKDTGKMVILITGATDGLGRQVAEDLAFTGASVLLHGRNREKGEKALEKIQSATGNGQLHYYNADFSSIAEVNRLAAAIKVDHPRLDVLVNNAGLGAGLLPKQRELSDDGYELRFAVNYLSPFLLSHRLLPLLKRASEDKGEARIINVASAAQEPLDFEDLMMEEDYSGMRAYAQSKLALVMFSFDLALELGESGVTVNTLHPASLMDTKMVREWFGSPRKTVEEGASALERLIMEDDLKGVTGAYFDGQYLSRAADQAYDLEARLRLRELSERRVGI